LRRHAVEEKRLPQRGWGLALLVHRGVVAWMRAWPKPESKPASRSDVLRDDQAAFQPSVSLAGQIAAAWVNVILSQRAVRQTCQRNHGESN